MGKEKTGGSLDICMYEYDDDGLYGLLLRALHVPMIVLPMCLKLFSFVPTFYFAASIKRQTFCHELLRGLTWGESSFQSGFTLQFEKQIQSF